MDILVSVLLANVSMRAELASVVTNLQIACLASVKLLLGEADGYPKKNQHFSYCYTVFVFVYSNSIKVLCFGLTR